MRVLLVNSNRSCEFMPAAPIGLSYVAEATREAGHDVRFLDLFPARRPHDDLRRSVREFRPQVAGISVRNIDNVVRQRLQGHLGELASQIAIVREESRRSCPDGTTVVLGGAAVSILRSAALKHLDADVAVCGEGECSFPALLSALENGRNPDEVPGLCYRSGGTIHATPSLPVRRAGPSGMQNWIDWPTYERHGATWPIQTKRGCSMPCSYCTYPVIEGSAHRGRPAAEVVEEMEEVMRRVAPRTIEIVDSTFNVPAEHALRICEEIIRRNLKVRLTAMGINPAQVSRELFGVMKRAGFNSMMITPEAANETMLRSLRKGFSLEHVLRSARLSRESKLHSIWFFMLGGPGETRETVEETISFIERELASRRSLVVVFTGIRILPGTELAREAIDRGHIPAGTDLSRPVFYQSPLVGETSILDRINIAIGRCPNIVHAAEELQKEYASIVHLAFYLARVAPPFWRFLPYFIWLAPVRSRRRRRPTVGRASHSQTFS